MSQLVDTSSPTGTGLDGTYDYLLEDLGGRTRLSVVAGLSTITGSTRFSNRR